MAVKRLRTLRPMAVAPMEPIGMFMIVPDPANDVVN
jgi:hypothetical protein